MKAKHYNNFPEGFPNPINDPRYRSGIVTFRLYGLKKDPDYEGEGVRYLMAGTQAPTPTAVIQWEDKEGTVHNIPIALIKGVSADGEAHIEGMEMQFLASRQGILTLNPEVPKQRKILEFMLMTPQNLNSPFRNESSPKPMFYEVNPDKEAKEEVTKNDLIRQALNHVGDLSDIQLRELFTNVEQRNSQAYTINQVKKTLEGLALSSPEKILKYAEKKSASYEAMAKQAASMKIIKNDQKAMAFVWVKSGEKIFEYETGKGKPKVYDQFSAFLDANKEVAEKIKLAIEIEQE